MSPRGALGRRGLLKISGAIGIVHYWGGCPQSANSKWQRFLSLIQRCREHGWRNYLVWSRMPDDRALVEPFREAGCEIILLPPSRRNFDPASIWRVYRLLRRLECDLFHCHNDHTSPLMGAVLARVPIRLWSKLAMSPYYERGISPRGLHRLMLSTRVSCVCASRVLAISDQVRRELVDSVGFGERIDTIRGPVDSERFANARKGDIRRQLGLDPSDVLITAVGRAVPVKGWDVVIRASAEVHRLFPNAHIAFVGSTTSPEETDFFEKLAGLLRESNGSDHIHFLGHRDDIPGILKASDVFILPSRSEGMPAALIEAMAAGLPCVAAKVGGIPEVITHGEDGLLFERENAEQLAECVIGLIRNQSLRARIASHAANRAHEFGMRAYVDKVFRCYEALLGVPVAKSQKHEASPARR